MNKVEYLEALKSVLKDTDHSIMEEILADYEEHFQAGIENGKTEEEICNDLGSIEDLVEEIKEVYQTGSSNNSSRKKDKADGENDNKKGFKYWSFNFDSIDGEKIGNAINSAFESAGEAISNIDVKEIGNTLKNTFDQAASSFSQFTDSLKNQAGNPFSDYARRYDKNAESTNENCEKSFSSEDPDTKKSKDTNADVQTVSFDAEGNREDIDTAKVDENVNVDSVNSQEPETQAVEDGANTVPTENKADETFTCEEGAVQTEEETKEQVQEEVKEQVTEEQGVQEEIQENDEAIDDTKEVEDPERLSIVIDASCANVFLVPSKNGKVNVSYQNDGNERQKQNFEFYSYKEKNRIYAGVRRTGKSVFFHSFNVDCIKLNVEIPKDMKLVQIKTSSGDIEATDVKADSVVIETLSGDASIKNVYATETKVKTTSGDITLVNVDAIKLGVHSMSGEINVDDIVAKNLLLKNTSGDIKGTTMKSEIMDISSMSGDIKFTDVKSGDGKIKSTSGDVKIKDIELNNADVTSTSGNVECINVLGDAIRLCSVSGNVVGDINVKRCHASSKSGKVEVKCTGNILLEAGSTSGQVKVTLKNNGNGYKIQSRTTTGNLYINYNGEYHRKLKTGVYTYGNEGSELILSSVSRDIYVND